jgi:hypothetical protein
MGAQPSGAAHGDGVIFPTFARRGGREADGVIFPTFARRGGREADGVVTAA